MADAAAQRPVEIPELTAAGNALKANNVEKARQQFEKALSKASDTPLLYRAIMGECTEVGPIWIWPASTANARFRSAGTFPNADRAELYETLASCYADGHEPPPATSRYRVRAPRAWNSRRTMPTR